MAGYRVDEGQFGGVQGLTRRTAGALLRPLAHGMGICLLATEAMADFGTRMNADLMRPASFQAAFEDRAVYQVLHRTHMRDRVLRLLGVGG